MICTRCGNPLSSRARFCGRCGRLQAGPEETSPGTTRACTMCGAGVEDEWKFCRTCGSPSTWAPPLGGAASSAASAAIGSNDVTGSGGVTALSVTMVEDRPEPLDPAPRPMPAPASASVERRTRSRLGAWRLALVLLIGVALGAFLYSLSEGGLRFRVDSLHQRLEASATAQASLSEIITGLRARVQKEKARGPIRSFVGHADVGAVRAWVESRGWTLRVRSRASSEPAGTVLSQSPPPGTPMRAGETVTVTVAR